MKIGRIEQVSLRDLWKNEADDFTTWLAENLDALSEAVDINLELIEQEKQVDDSRFTVDLWLADDEGDTVIIENQLEKTDHTHLGQVVTYASNMDAKTVIWVTREARQEHINAANWLNEFTNKGFYIVELSAVKIGNSDPAPQFNVVCKPSEEMKHIGESKRVMNDVKIARHARKDASDTLIVPARKEGFERVFLGENQWYSIRINETRISQIKYIAGYQVAPISAVTHIAEVKEIVPADEAGKFRIIFKGPAKEITHTPIGNGSKIQSPVYCERSRLLNSKTITEALSISAYAPKKKSA